MNPNIYNRPMFQTPQRRAGGGIMAGVAPINMNDGGDPNDTWLGVGKGIASSLYDQGSNLVENINMPSPGELGISYDDDGVGLDLDELGDFANEQITASEDGFLGVFDGKPITMRDATDFFLVDPEDPTDVALATASAALLAFPPAAAAATLARYGWKGKKMFEKWAEYQKRFAPSKGTGNLATNFIKRRVFPTQESIASGLGNPLRPGQRYASFEMNRFLADEAGDLLIPSAKAEELPLMVEDPAGIAALENERVALEPMVEEAEAEAESGIANVARSIAEARSDKFKSPTFRKDDKDLAAVTKEDLIDAGYEGPGALTDYLNDMKFDDELGRYIEEIEAEGKANGGIMRLNGGGKVGLAKGFWNWIKSIRRKKPKDRTQKETDALNKAQEEAPWTEADLRANRGEAPPWRQEDLKPKAPVTKPGPEGKTVTDPNNPGFIKRNWGKGVVAAAAASPFVYDALSPDGDPVPGTATTTATTTAAAGDADPVPVPVPVPVPDPDDRDFITKTTDYLKGSLSTLKDQYASDPRKAMFIAGQMMKAREGIVPINALTALTEAEVQWEKIVGDEKSQAAGDKPELFQMYDAIVAEQKALGTPMSEETKQSLITSLFDLSRSESFMQTLFKGIALNPQIMADGRFTDIIAQLSTDKGGDIAKLLQDHSENYKT